MQSQESLKVQEGGGRGNQRKGEGERVRGSCDCGGKAQKGIVLLALKTEEGVTSQEMWAASRHWKR